MTNQNQYSAMDPWSCCQTGVSISENNAKFEFEDNFTPVLEKLPDSNEYLAILEEKLKKIKTDQNILEQLTAKREACMQELLNNGSNGNSANHVDEDILNLDEPISNSQVIRAIAPQRQALNQGEIVELIKYDQLEYEDSDSSIKSINSQ